jgi:hypothetical protein
VTGDNNLAVVLRDSQCLFNERWFGKMLKNPLLTSNPIAAATIRMRKPTTYKKASPFWNRAFGKNVVVSHDYARTAQLPR